MHFYSFSLYALDLFSGRSVLQIRSHAHVHLSHVHTLWLHDEMDCMGDEILKEARGVFACTQQMLCGHMHPKAPLIGPQCVSETLRTLLTPVLTSDPL